MGDGYSGRCPPATCAARTTLSRPPIRLLSPSLLLLQRVIRRATKELEKGGDLDSDEDVR